MGEDVVELPKLHRRESSSSSSSSAPSSSVRPHVPSGPAATLRALAGRIRHPGLKTWPAVMDERRRGDEGEHELVSVAEPVVAAASRRRPWNISDIFGMGHRSQRRGGHCLNLSPRIEVCLLTCIPSRGARRETFRGPQGRADRAPRPALVIRVFSTKVPILRKGRHTQVPFASCRNTFRRGCGR